MEQKWFERILIGAALAAVAVLIYANFAYAAGTVCQIANGCTGTSTAPTYGELLAGNASSTYSLIATSTLGLPTFGTRNTWSQLQLFAGDASSTESSCFGPCYFGGTATSSFSSAGALSLASPLSIANGGTGTSTAVSTGVCWNSGGSTGFLECDGRLTWNGTDFGIATSSPSNLLTVAGTNQDNLSYDGTNLYVNTDYANLGGGSIAIEPGSGAGDVVFAAEASTGVDPFSFKVSSASSRGMTVGNLSSGGFQTTFGGDVAGINLQEGTNYVGINATSTPWGLLSIAGSAGGTTPLLAISSSTAAYATTTVFEIDQNGNATMSAGTSLTVNGQGNSIVLDNANSSASDVSYISFTGNRGFVGYDNGVMFLQSGSSKNIEFAVNSGTFGSGQIAQFTQQANFEFGTTTATNINGSEFDITATTTNSATLNLFNISSSTGASLFSVSNAGATKIASGSNTATSSLEIGQSTQTKGSCVTYFDEAGSPVYMTFAPGATSPTYQNGGTAPTGCSD